MNQQCSQRALLPVLGLALSVLAACTTPAESLIGTPLPLPSPPPALPSPPPALPTLAPGGMWGGPHVGLTLDANGATLEFDCAHGSLSAPLTLDANGHFDIAGTYAVEGGVMSQEPPPARPARYSGTIAGQTMTLKVLLTDENQEVGTYTLGLGQPASLRKCV